MIPPPPDPSTAENIAVSGGKGPMYSTKNKDISRAGPPLPSALPTGGGARRRGDYKDINFVIAASGHGIKIVFLL